MSDKNKNKNKNKRFLNNLNKQFHSNNRKLFDPDKEIPETQMDDSNKAHLERMNFDPEREVTVVRLAVLKDGSIYYDCGNASNALVYGMAKAFCEIAKNNLDNDFNRNNGSDN